jgi:hypothetical protein
MKDHLSSAVSKLKKLRRILNVIKIGEPDSEDRICREVEILLGKVRLDGPKVSVLGGAWDVEEAGLDWDRCWPQIVAL